MVCWELEDCGGKEDVILGHLLGVVVVGDPCAFPWSCVAPGETWEGFKCKQIKLRYEIYTGTPDLIIIPKKLPLFSV